MAEDTHSELRITLAPAPTDASFLEEVGNTGLHLVSADAAFEAAGLRALDRAAIAAGAAPGPTVIAPVAAATQYRGANCQVVIVPNLAADAGCPVGRFPQQTVNKNKLCS